MTKEQAFKEASEQAVGHNVPMAVVHDPYGIEEPTKYGFCPLYAVSLLFPLGRIETLIPSPTASTFVPKKKS